VTVAHSQAGSVEIELPGGVVLRVQGWVDSGVGGGAERTARWMILPPAGVRVWLAAGATDMRKGFDGLAGLVQTQLSADPFSGQLFVFRGRQGDKIKVLWWDGDGLCLFSKRLERGRFIWPQAACGTVSLTSAQLSMLLEGIDWRRPTRTFDPQLAV
jgi:transposase